MVSIRTNFVLFSYICIGFAYCGAVPLLMAEPEAIRNVSSVNQVSNTWDTELYDKEIGTWCQPDDEVTESTPIQRMPLPPDDDPAEAHETLTRWVDAALRVVRAHLLAGQAANCSQEPSDGSWCVQQPPNQRPVPGDMNLYVADGRQRMEAVLPDGSLSKSGAHDAWILLDPTPQLAMGHTVYLFAVDVNTSDVSCISSGGIPLGNSIIISQFNK